MRWWKWLGLAGLVGVAAVGAAAGARAVQQRRARAWREYEPHELRDRLHERLRTSSAATAVADGAPAAPHEATTSSG
jgi:hypothetical protein